jgi:hypothetical protein
LFLNDEREIDDALHALDGYFQQEDHCEAVQLVFRKEQIGYLNRKDFAAASSGRALGTSQHGELPGPQLQYKFIRLQCPVPGCTTLVLIIHYDELNPPRCLIHPRVTLRSTHET